MPRTAARCTAACTLAAAAPAAPCHGCRRAVAPPCGGGPHAELRTLETEHGGAVRADLRKTVGDVGTAFVMAGLDTDLLVMQASGTHVD